MPLRWRSKVVATATEFSKELRSRFSADRGQNSEPIHTGQLSRAGMTRTLMPAPTSACEANPARSSDRFRGSRRVRSRSPAIASRPRNRPGDFRNGTGSSFQAMSGSRGGSRCTNGAVARSSGSSDAHLRTFGRTCWLRLIVRGVETFGLPWQVGTTLGATPKGYTRCSWRAVRPDFTGLSRSRLLWRRGRDSNPR